MHKYASLICQDSVIFINKLTRERFSHNYALNMHKYADPKSTLFSENQAASGLFSVGIVGARGYSGLVLAELLAHHPQVGKIVNLLNDAKPFSWNEVAPGASWTAAIENKLASELDPSTLDAIFLATPAEASIEFTSKWLAKAKLIIDLSGAYRLDSKDYPSFYAFEHGDAANLAKAQYGLCPFAEPKSAKLIANPGCYATASLMAIIPLLKAGLIDADSIVIDAKSGTTGAGKKPREDLLFSESDGNCTPYKIGAHQHAPEISKYASFFSKKPVAETWFTPHLIAVKRGIIASIYARVKNGVTENQIAKAYESAYANYPLVQVAALSSLSSDAARKFLSLSSVEKTPYARIGYQLAETKLHVFSVIDNLMKGAASQAIENFNRANDLPLNLGLSPIFKQSRAQAQTSIVSERTMQT